MPRLRTAIPAEIAALNKRLNTEALALMQPEAIADWERLGFIKREEDGDGTFDRPARLKLIVDAEALASYLPEVGSRVSPLAAVWLYAIRASIEREGAVTAAAWCASCGAACSDGRVDRGHVARIRQWCDSCASKRHRREYRACAAADCMNWLWTTRANQLYCSDGCLEADRRRRKQPTS